MSQKKNEGARQSRRRTLKTLGIGAIAGSQSLPEQWMKPVVSSIIMPAHAQTTPAAGPAVECRIFEVSLQENEEGSEAGFFAEVGVEADAGTPVTAFIRNPGIEFNGGTGDLQFSSVVEGGGAGPDGSNIAFFEAGFDIESSSSAEIAIDFDVGDDGEIDCGAEVGIQPE